MLKLFRRKQESPSALRVKNGAALLDRTIGCGWEARIDTSILDIADGKRCILGQLYADPFLDDNGFSNGYGRGLDDLYVRAGWFSSHPYGFLASEDTEEWVKLIDERRLALSV